MVLNLIFLILKLSFINRFVFEAIKKKIKHCICQLFTRKKRKYFSLMSSLKPPESTLEKEKDESLNYWHC